MRIEPQLGRTRAEGHWANGAEALVVLLPGTEHRRQELLEHLRRTVVRVVERRRRKRPERRRNYWLETCRKIKLALCDHVRYIDNVMLS